MPIEIRVPRLNANDIDVLVLRWLVKPGDPVEEGQIICELETTKAALEWETPRSGYVYPQVAEGAWTKVGALLALVFPEADTGRRYAAADFSGEDRTTPSRVVVSDEAARLMSENDLDASEFRDLRVIDGSAVRRRLRERAGCSGDLPFTALPERAIVLYGAGRHGAVVLDTLRRSRQYTPVAFVDARGSGEFEGLPILAPEQLSAVAALGFCRSHISFADRVGVSRAASELRSADLPLTTIVDLSAIVSSQAEIGEGCYIGPLCVVGPHVRLRAFCHLNNGCSVAHHCTLEEQVLISDGARLGGNVRIGPRTQIGLGATVNKDVRIGAECVVVSGASVHDDVPDQHVVRMPANLLAQIKY